MRKKTYSLIFAFIFCFSTCINSFAINLSASSVAVINAETKELIFEKNAFKKRSMASTTKIMTSLIAVESGKLDETVTIDSSSSVVEGTAIGLKPGYKLKLRDLVYSMLLESGNDAALATAVFLAGDEENFSFLMNKRASQIGMDSTSFVTASGLDSENHYTCAYDMALLGATAISNPIFRKICSTEKHSFDFIAPDKRLTLSNHNKLLKTNDAVFGIKTGFTKKSGRCLVSAIEINDNPFVVVTLNAPNDWNDHIALYDYIRENTEKVRYSIDLPSMVSIQGGVKDSISINKINCTVLAKNKNCKINAKVFLPRFIYAPIKCKDIIGRIELYFNDTHFKTINIQSEENIKALEETYIEKQNLFKKIKTLIFNK